MWPELSTRLEGRLVVLEPLAAEHKEPLRNAGADEVVWRWMQVDGSTHDGFELWFEDTLQRGKNGTEAPFATVERASGRVIGSTRFMHLRPEHRGVEIGGTWIERCAWRGGANVDAKLLMLEHAFDRCGCMRVEFKTDARNVGSRRALEALPAVCEGVFRRHMRAHYGIRDSAYYAIVDDDWPQVRANLERRLAEKVG